MPYKLRFVQKFKIAHEKEFFELEKKFEIFEQTIPNLPKTKRYKVFSGTQPTNSIIWECDFDTLDHLMSIHEYLNTSEAHEDLFKQQSIFITESYTEIYKPYDQ